jgi:hypothetical protein
MTPTSAPPAMAATSPSQGMPRSRAQKANRNPESEMIAGNDRSISPAATTRVRPSARISSGGIVTRNEL